MRSGSCLLEPEISCSSVGLYLMGFFLESVYVCARACVCCNLSSRALGRFIGFLRPFTDISWKKQMFPFKCIK